MSRRDDILARARGIEALPPMALELLTLLQSPDAEMEAVARVIEHEPAIVAHVLRLANAASTGAAEPIRSIKQAVVRIGLRQTSELVLDAVVAPHAGKPVRGYDLPPGGLWEHSVATAIMTDLLSEARGEPAPIEAFTAGLLHDLGKLVLGHFVEVESEPILELAFGRALSFEQAEREVLGVDHAEVGAALLDAWGIEGTIRDAVRWHHDPDAAPAESRDVARLVHAAAQIVIAAGIGGGSDGCQYHTSPDALDAIGIEPRLVEQALCGLMPRLDAVRGPQPSPIGSARA